MGPTRAKICADSGTPNYRHCWTEGWRREEHCRQNYQSCAATLCNEYGSSSYCCKCGGGRWYYQLMPSDHPSDNPSSLPTRLQTNTPTNSLMPSLLPSLMPSMSIVPSIFPTVTVSINPSVLPSPAPSDEPSR